MNDENIKADNHKTDNIKMMVRFGLLAGGVTLLGIGLTDGGYTDVLNKAIRICYECIGIG